MYHLEWIWSNDIGNDTVLSHQAPPSYAPALLSDFAQQRHSLKICCVGVLIHQVIM